ncbi:MAG: SelB C-terminal domain-containing protein, partial [Thermoanaerobaculia bacterium]
DLRSGPAGAGAPRYLQAALLEAVRRTARERLATYLEDHPLESGIGKAAAIRQLLPRAAQKLADLYFSHLAATGDLLLSNDEIRLPGRSVELPDDLSPLARALVERYETAGLAPPGPGEVARDLAAKSQIVDGLLQHLVKRKALIRLSSGLLIAARAVARLAEDLQATGWDHFSIPQFKDRFSLSRKWAIPLLEHLDGIGVTRRVGEERQICSPRPPSKGLERSPSH